MTETDYAAFLDLLYGAAVEQGEWEGVIARFADLIGGAKAWMPSLDLYSGGGGGIIARIDPTAQESYFQYYYATNPFVPPGGAALAEPWPLAVTTDEDRFAKEEFTATEYYNDFLLPQDIHSVAIVRLGRVGGLQSTLNITRPRHKAQFTRAELALAERLHPHLIRAFNLTRKFSEVRREKDDLVSMFNRSAHGLFLLSADGRVLQVNRAGEALAAEPEGLQLAGGRLEAANPPDGRRLHALIGAAGAADGEHRSGGSMALSTPGRRLPLSITVAPIRSERLAPFHSGRSILVCVTDLEAGISLPEQRLRDLFGLTVAETRVALALFEGLAPRDAAAKLGVSPHTIHVHLARIFDKTGARRQSELVLLMMRTVGVGLT